MTREELMSVIKLIDQCDRYTNGQSCGDWINQIAKDAALKAVIDRRESLFERLRCAGLNIVDEER